MNPDKVIVAVNAYSPDAVSQFRGLLGGGLRAFRMWVTESGIATPRSRPRSCATGTRCCGCICARSACIGMSVGRRFGARRGLRPHPEPVLPTPITGRARSSTPGRRTCTIRNASTGIFALACWLALPADLFAQNDSAQESSNGRKSGTYLKLGLAHWQGDIFSERALTQWSVDLFGADYNLTSLDVEIEGYFPRAFIVSGLSLGYRKDALRFAERATCLAACSSATST